MHIKTLITVLCLFYSFNSFAANYIDSIGVENNNGKKVIIHKIEPKETYYSLGRKYNISPKTIIEFNDNKPLQIGTIIKVPTTSNFNQPAKVVARHENMTTTQPGGDILDYKVGPKETLFSIARRFNTTVDDIKTLNNLKSTELRVGQVIKVRQNANPQPEPNRVTITPSPAILQNPADTNSLDSNLREIPANRYGLHEQSEHGVAVWIDEPGLDAAKMYALHRSAPVGTVVKITNPMNGKSTFAKVVGKFAENETTKDVIIVVTKATADVLGALDKRFQVNINF